MAEFGQLWPLFAKLGEEWANIDRCCFFEVGPTLANLGQHLATVDQKWLSLAESGLPKLLLANLGEVHMSIVAFLCESTGFWLPAERWCLGRWHIGQDISFDTSRGGETYSKGLCSPTEWDRSQMGGRPNSVWTKPVAANHVRMQRSRNLGSRAGRDARTRLRHVKSFRWDRCSSSASCLGPPPAKFWPTTTLRTAGPGRPSIELPWSCPPPRHTQGKC